MKTLLLIAAGLLALILTLVVGLFVWARFSDGPLGPIAGGALDSGEYVEASGVDWNSVLGEKPVVEIELQLESTGTSRTTGAFAHNGHLYVPCDLGYVWRRLPNGTARLVLHTMWLSKDWHLRAQEDGRAVVRINSNLYRLNAVRVNDEALLSGFRKHVSEAAAGAFELLDVRTNPEDIWFFRLDPR